ncbi:DUF2795 domain-containing protein [Methanoculleus sp. Wushi-C6]|uniref:DUF2795 domain-containing protein n=1 Tax=Methanoculleus caldifontis TaxID=2651577 RepID=A0ABU3X159_9EURY|nr:DUF2795 domain-containing protein [Methanoculleus sp. Wushi-C6]MDV2481352.1 DUF2795 domain-containing protein [Methanoculleus sp. Wushi-C6]
MAERQAGPVLETRRGMEETVDLMRADDISNIKVQNPEGEGLGDLTEVAIDRKSGCIAYAVLAYGGILGFGEKRFAIPWEAVRIRPREKVAIVDTDRRTLDNAQGFARDTMPGESDWSVIRTAPAQRKIEPSARGAGEAIPPSRVESEARPAESTFPGGERDIPPQPAVQTVAGGWGGQPTRRQTEERPVRAEVRPTGAVVEEVRREEPARPETRPVTEAKQPLTTRGPSPGHLSAADLQVYLKGMDYPAERRDLVSRARRNDAPDSVITTLEGFSDRTYKSAADVSVEFGRETRGGHPASTEMPPAPEISAEEVQRERLVSREEMVQAPVVTAEAREERHETRRAGPSPARLSAADLQVYLKGMDYPAGRQEIIARARENDAPESVIAALEEFSNRTYHSATDVSKEFGSIR